LRASARVTLFSKKRSSLQQEQQASEINTRTVGLLIASETNTRTVGLLKASALYLKHSTHGKHQALLDLQ
jgi:hypothetical protein